MSQAGSNLDTVNISVTGVDTLTDYSRLSDYLSGLTAVVDMQVARVAGTEIQYALQLNGSLQDLTHTVTIGTVLEPLAIDTPGSFRLRQ